MCLVLEAGASVRWRKEAGGAGVMPPPERSGRAPPLGPAQL